MFNVLSFPSLWNKIITFRHTLSSSLFSQAAEGASHTCTSLELGLRVDTSCFPHCGLAVMHVGYILFVHCFCALDIFLNTLKCMLQNLQLKVINVSVTWLCSLFLQPPPSSADLTTGTQTFTLANPSDEKLQIFALWQISHRLMGFAIVFLSHYLLSSLVQSPPLWTQLKKDLQ